MTAKADRVRKLLESPDLQEAFDNVRQFYLGLIETLPVDPENGKDALYNIREKLLLLRQVRDDLEKAIEHGNVEDFNATVNDRPTFLGELKWPRKHNR